MLDRNKPWYKNKLDYIKEYNRNSYKRVAVNLNKELDKDILSWLNGKSASTYIKALIRADIRSSHRA